MARHWLLLFLPVMSFLVQAQEWVPAQEPSPRHLAHIEVHSVAELNRLLLRAEQLFDSGKLKAGSDTPVAFVLHGAEAKSLLNAHYRENKPLVDLAARLSAFKVVDIKVCKTWLGGSGLNDDQLPPFISTVPYGPGEVKRLMEEESYVYF